MNASAPSKREALLADVTGVQVALEALGGRELPEDVALLFGLKRMLEAPSWNSSCSHSRSSESDMVRELGADVAGVDVLQLCEDVPELHALRHPRVRAVRLVRTRIEIPPP